MKSLRILLVLLFVPLAARAAISYDPDLVWETQESAHFRVHYHSEVAYLVPQTVAIAEAAHDRLTRYFEWEPRAKTHVVLTDRNDYSNGSATPLPANTMRIFVSPPDDLQSLEDHGGWLETVIVHEYTHILHLDKATGGAGRIRGLFGRLPIPYSVFVFPNVAQPTWFVEGIATYVETDHERGIGRGQSSFYDMYMRMEVLRKVRSYREVNQLVRDWPGGTLFYLYGVQFYEFLRETYGEASIKEMVDAYSNNFLPFFVNYNTRQVFGKNLDELWIEFESWLNNRYLPTINRIRDKGVGEGERLTNIGYLAQQTRVMNGDVYYVRHDGRNPRALVRWDAKTRKETPLFEVQGNARFDTHEQAGIILSQIEISENTNQFYELYYLETPDSAPRKLTHHGRYRFVAWHPSGDHFAAVHYENGRFGMRVLNRDAEVIMDLWDAPAEVVIGGIDWAPSGDSIVASVWRPASGWNVEEFDILQRTWKTLIGDENIEGHVAYTLDGKSVLFTSDEGGVYNLRRFDLETGEAVTITNALGGAFFPAEDENYLYYLGYDATGYDLFRVRRKAQLDPMPISTAREHTQYKHYTLDDDQSLEQSGYAPWREMMPQWWFPVWGATDEQSVLGFTTSGADPLFRHQYYTLLAYDVKRDKPNLVLNYQYDRFYPLLSTTFTRTYPENYTKAGKLESIDENDIFQLDFIFPFLKIRTQNALHLSYTSDVTRTDYHVANQERELNDSYFGVALTHNTARSFPLSISRSHGRSVSLSYTDSEMTQSDSPGQIVRGNWREYLSLGGERVFAVRGTFGFGIGDTQKFNLGDYVDVVSGADEGGALFSKRKYVLRGYPTNLAQLTGKRMGLVSAEFRFPLQRIQRGIMIPPVSMDQLSWTTFVDSGSAWDSGILPEKTFSAVGIELGLDNTLFYLLPIHWRIGWAYGLNAGGEGKPYVSVGSSF